MTYNSYGKTFDKEFYLSLIKRCDMKNKEKVLSNLIDNNKLLLQLNILTNLNDIYLKKSIKLNLKYFILNLNKRISLIQKTYIKNSSRILLYFKSSFKESFINRLLIKFCFVLNKQSLQYNFDHIILLNELYSILLENFHEKTFYINITKLSLYKFDKGFMEDILNNNNNSSLIESFNYRIFSNIVFLNRILFLLKRKIYSNKFKYVSLEDKVLGRQGYVTYIYFCFTNLFRLNLNFYKSLNKILFNIIISFYFFTNVLKRNTFLRLNVLGKLEKGNLVFKNSNLIRFNKIFFFNLFKIKYLFVLLNEKLFKKK